jgi:hypothetical protein
MLPSNHCSINGEIGVENPWKSGMKQMKCSYPDFGRFMRINKMPAFCSAAP